MYTCYSDNKQKGHYIVKTGISDEQFLSLEKSLGYIQNVSKDIDYWCLIDHNIIRMKDTTKNYCSKESEIFVEINGAFANLLSSYYLWKCYNQHEHSSSFKALQEDYRKKYIECHLISELRNYLAHDGFAISSTTFDVLNEIMHFNVSPQAIIDSKRKSGHKPNTELKKYLSELINAGKEIDAIPLVDRFQQIYLEIQTRLWQQREADTKHALQQILEVVPKEYPDLYNSYIISEDGEKYLNTGHQMHHFICRAQKYYSKFLEV